MAINNCWEITDKTSKIARSDSFQVQRLDQADQIRKKNPQAQ